jgi:protein TonB
MFTIDKNGEISDVRARAPHKRLEEEAKRIIYRYLPKVIPGKQKGKAVAVKYSLPIVFNVAKK